MVQIRIRDAEACEPQPLLLWDSVWVDRLDAGGGYADWMLAPADETGNQGGLRAQAALHTATLILLMTDRRLPAEMTPPGNDADPRGWWGDSVRLEGEPDVEMGSLLWTLERAPLTDETARLAKVYAEDALAVLADQGVVSRTVVETEVRKAQGFLGLVATHYDHAGNQTYRQEFDVLWTQAARNAPMNFGEQGVFT